VAHRAGRRQVSVWLAEAEWRALDAMVRRAGLSRSGAFAVLLQDMGRASLAEAVLSDAPGRYRQGWAAPLRDEKAPRTRFGRVRVAVWLSASLAARVNEAFRLERRRRGVRALSFRSLVEACSSFESDPDRVGRLSP
jgi:hypothetical protein